MAPEKRFKTIKVLNWSVDLPTVNAQGRISTDYSAVYCLTEAEILMHYEFVLILLKVEQQEFSPS